MISDTTAGQPEISVVIPTYNEEENVVQITEAVIRELSPLVGDFEIVIIDNGSTDRTVELVRDLCARYAYVRCIVNTRNFGQMRSPTHAIYAARGRAVIGMCADFQDPPTLLPEFVARWRAGEKIVLGVRKSEPTGPILRAFRDLSYRVLAELGEVKTIVGATGFGLYDAQVVAVLKKWNDPDPFFRAMLVESGYDVATVPYERPPRIRGETKNDWRSLTVFALAALPLVSRNVFRIAFSASLAFIVVGVLLALLALPAAMLTPAWAQWAGLGIGMTLLGMVVTLIAMVGIQVMAVSDRVRQVPLVIENERINFDT